MPKKRTGTRGRARPQQRRENQKRYSVEDRQAASRAALDPGVSHARKVLVETRESLLAQVRELERVIEHFDSTQTGSGTRRTKKSFQELFAARDQTEPGSREEEQAAQRILETMFPDTNAG